MKVQCRKFKEEDLEAVRRLLVELGYPMELDLLRTNINAIYNNNGVVFVAEVNNVVIGSVCVIVDARLAEGVYAEIVSLIVSEQRRGKGVGKTLFEKAENWAQNRVDKIRVRANEVRRDAHLFYRNQGFEEVKTQKIFIKKL